MKRKTILPLLSAFLMIILIFNGSYIHNGFVSAVINQNFEWKVEIGDSQTYTYKIFYDIREPSLEEYQISGIAVNGQIVSVIVREGTKITYTISSIPITGSLRCEMTYNSNVTLIEEFIPAIIVMKTTENKSYWEEQIYGNDSIFLQRNLVIQETINQGLYYDDGGQIFPYTLISTFKWNWETGWLTYFYIRAFFMNETYIEEEFEASTDPSNPLFQPNVIFGITFLCILFAALAVEIKFQNK